MIGDRWNVTDDEVRRHYPCDDLMPDPALAAWRGVTVHAPASRVWPWVGQIRLAPYAYDWIDNLGRRSPPDLRRLPEPRVGEHFTSVGGRAQGRIVAVEPGRSLTGRILGALMSYVVEPVPEPASEPASEPGSESSGAGTRLLLKVVSRHRGPVARALCVGDLVMARRQLLNLADLAERNR
ncbi:hypothetical protein [Nocardioides sp. YIM 152588]|uniref:hypothetical protein n=1 Tax=Nocardioides sp. YIM 152588 TaxID=3158259 RepID=UPI0032E46834